jgi:subtilisin family serine protease
MPIRVLNEDGRGFESEIDEGVRWAVDHGADVVNLSLGGDDIVIENLSGGTLPATLDYAWENGVVPVVSSGNQGFFRTELADARALIVTATTADDTRADYATDVGFARWGIAAPGGTDAGGKDTMVFSTLWSTKGARYGWAYGTSMAAPHVAGAAAILRGAGFTAQQTVDRLLSTAKDLGASGDDLTYGHGRVDVAAAVEGLPRKKAASSASTPSEETPQPDDGAGGAPVLRPARTPSTSSPTDDPSPTEAARTDPPTASPDRRVAAAEEEEDSRSMLPNLIIGGLVIAALGGLLVFGRLRQIKG